jgi:hypothetical protein
MIVDMVTHELSPGITAISFTGRLVLGNRLSDDEHALREPIKQGSRKLVLDFCGSSLLPRRSPRTEVPVGLT